MCEGTVINKIAQAVVAYHAHKNAGNLRMAEEAEDRVREMAKEFLPSGSGINNGTTVNLIKSNAYILEMFCIFYHIENGTYGPRTGHRIIASASLASGFLLTITGEDYNGIKEYLYDTFRQALEFNVETQS